MYFMTLYKSIRYVKLMNLHTRDGILWDSEGQIISDVLVDQTDSLPKAYICPRM